MIFIYSKNKIPFFFSLTDASEDFRELTFKYNENSRSHLLKINLTNSVSLFKNRFNENISFI